MTADNTTRSAPWYKHPWVWFIIIVPVFSVALSFWLLYTAIVNKDPDVRDDWYKDKRAINQDLSRDSLAMSLNLQADLTSQGQTVNIAITSPGPLPEGILPPALNLVLSHPTAQERDIHAVLARTPDGRYAGSLPSLPEGRYYLELGSKQWRLKETVSFPAERITLQPKPL